MDKESERSYELKKCAKCHQRFPSLLKGCPFCLENGDGESERRTPDDG